MKKKVCVYAICKNEEKFVERWMDAVSEADLVLVLDTGSTDNTVELLRKRGAVVYEQNISPWRFDIARNVAIDLIPKDIDICLATDLDEVIDSGWREALECKWTLATTQAGYWLNDKYDGVLIKYLSKKIHRRNGFRWIRPVHEILEYSGTDPENCISIDEIVVRHFPDHEKSRSQYLPLLELSAQENPNDGSVIFSLGQEYVVNGMNEKGIKTLEYHLKKSVLAPPQDRSTTMRYIGQAYLADGDIKEAKKWLYRAVGECSQLWEPWAAIMNLGYQTRNWPLAFWAAQKGLEIQQNYHTEPVSWSCVLYDIGAIACYNLGIIDQALSYANAACCISPDDERLQNNLKLIQQKQREGISNESL